MPSNSTLVSAKGCSSVRSCPIPLANLSSRTVLEASSREPVLALTSTSVTPRTVLEAPSLGVGSVGISSARSSLSRTSLNSRTRSSRTGSSILSP